MGLVLDHVALLVGEIEIALPRLEALGLAVGAIESFPGEGTREVYLGVGPGRLLLMQPLGTAGPTNTGSKSLLSGEKRDYHVGVGIPSRKFRLRQS